MAIFARASDALAWRDSRLPSNLVVMVWHGVARQGSTFMVAVWPGWSWCAMVASGKARRGPVWQGLNFMVVVWRGRLSRGLSSTGLVRHGRIKVWQGTHNASTLSHLMNCRGCIFPGTPGCLSSCGAPCGSTSMPAMAGGAATAGARLSCLRVTFIMCWS